MAMTKTLYLCIGRTEAECIDEYAEFGATPLFLDSDNKLKLADGCYDLHDFFYDNTLEVDEACDTADEACDTALNLMFDYIHNGHLHGHIEMPQHLGGDKFYFRVNNLDN
jgi:hypothetical protein